MDNRLHFEGCVKVYSALLLGIINQIQNNCVYLGVFMLNFSINMFNYGNSGFSLAGLWRLKIL